MSEAPKKFFSINIASKGKNWGDRVFLNIFNLDGPEPHPDDSERVLSNMDFGPASISFNIASAIEFALKMGAVPYTEKEAADNFWEPDDNEGKALDTVGYEDEPEVGTEFIF